MCVPCLENALNPALVGKKRGLLLLLGLPAAAAALFPPNFYYMFLFSRAPEFQGVRNEKKTSPHVFAQGQQQRSR